MCKASNRLHSEQREIRDGVQVPCMLSARCAPTSAVERAPSGKPYSPYAALSGSVGTSRLG